MLTVPVTIDGVTYAQSPEKILAPLGRTFDALGIPYVYQDGRFVVAGRKLNESGPTLPDGTRLLPVTALAGWNVKVVPEPEEERTRLDYGDRQVYVKLGEKRVTIDKSTQELRAVQGGLLVMSTRVSTGREGKRTPNGSFTAGPYKAVMHRSSIYANAPMPYSVQIEGDIFVHGYSSVPGAPASHGCIRLPLDGKARFFYEWVERGTPVEIVGSWNG